MPETRTCTQCRREKILKGFYKSLGVLRSECKECTKVNNVNYQKKNRSWKSRYVDDDTRRAYLREYYKNNKEKFAQYRKQFLETHPDYHKEYYRKRKEK